MHVQPSSRDDHAFPGDGFGGDLGEMRAEPETYLEGLGLKVFRVYIGFRG